MNREKMLYFSADNEERDMRLDLVSTRLEEIEENFQLHHITLSSIQGNCMV